MNSTNTDTNQLISDLVSAVVEAGQYVEEQERHGRAVTSADIDNRIEQEYRRTTSGRNATA